ncbi:hypothetical protein AX16_011027 [Volvariella volvacea WC 439]|nr:hypothetical protein AX16_011027 [Volvariella volvacea WC 439]
MAISALAPATLFIKLVDLPNELGTFYVGSMYLDSVAAIDSSIPDFHPTYQRYKFNDNMTNPSSSGSELLDSFLRSDLRATFLRYVVPLPRTSPRVVSARWWTDAFALNPICSWLPNVTEPSGLEHLPDGTIDFHLRSRAISFNLNPSRPFYNESYLFDMQCVSESLDRRSTIWNTTTDDVPSGGWSVWAMTIQSSSRAFDMAPWLPTFSTDSLRFAILMCTPGFSIEPVEVAIEESVLSISPTWPDNRGWNLDQRQAEFFFSTLLCNDSSFSETVLPLVQEGNIFDLSSAYATALQNTAQSYMSCALGEADTLFRRSIPTFTAPLGYVIASTALFVVLNAINIWAYFRSGKGEVFSLFAIAGLLHDSNVAEEVDRFRQENTERSVEDMQNKFEKELKNRFITLDHRDDAGESEVLVLHDADNHP